MESTVIKECFKNAKKDENCPKSFSAYCNFCPNKAIRGAICSSSNFILHLKRQHASEYQKFTKLQAGLSSDANDAGIGKRKREEESTELTKLQLKQGGLQFASTITQSQFNTAITALLIEDMMPDATVERSGFMKFCKKIAKGMKMPSRRTVGKQIDLIFDEEIEIMKKELQSAICISTTADIWSSHKRAYMGMTAHILNPDTLARSSYVLACKRFKGRHDYAAIANLISVT